MSSLYAEWGRQFPWWCRDDNEDASGIITGTQVTLARNLTGWRFPPFGGDHAAAEGSENEIRRLLEDSGLVEDLVEIRPAELDKDAKGFFTERGLMSASFTHGAVGRVAFVSHDEGREFLVNDTDHLKIGLQAGGLAIERLGEQMMDTWRRLEKATTQWVRSSRFGYVTSGVSEFGLGVVCHVAMHLPALAVSGRMDAVKRAINSLGMSLLPLMPGDREAETFLYQLCNRQTIGVSSNTLFRTMEQMAATLAHHERNARDWLMRESILELSDVVGKANGLLRGSFLLNYTDCSRALSLLLMGCKCGFMPHFEPDDILWVLSQCGDSHLAICGNLPKDANRLSARSNWIRSGLGYNW